MSLGSHCGVERVRVVDAAGPKTALHRLIPPSRLVVDLVHSRSPASTRGHQPVCQFHTSPKSYWQNQIVKGRESGSGIVCRAGLP